MQLSIERMLRSTKELGSELSMFAAVSPAREKGADDAAFEFPEMEASEDTGRTADSNRGKRRSRRGDAEGRMRSRRLVTEETQKVDMRAWLGANLERGERGTAMCQELRKNLRLKTAYGKIVAEAAEVGMGYRPPHEEAGLGAEQSLEV